MSEYKDFKYCIICRTKYIWNEYRISHGEEGFEVTFGINILTSLMVRVTGFEEEYGSIMKAPYNEIANAIKDRNKEKLPDGEIFCPERYCKWFRNSLAHIHIAPQKEEGEIRKIIFYSRCEGADVKFSFSAVDFCALIDDLLDILMRIVKCEFPKCQIKEVMNFEQPDLR